MPTYVYECTRCGHSFEKFHGISAKTPKRCPECRCAVRRKIGTGAGILFKGSGFYQTDYRSDGYKKEAKAEQGSAGKETPPKKEKTSAATSSSSQKSVSA